MSRSLKRTVTPALDLETEALDVKETVVSDKEGFDYSIHCERAQIADHLEILAKSFREGQVSLASGDKSIILEPASRVKLKLKAKVKPEKSKGELKIEVSWKEKDNPEQIDFNPL